MTSTSQKRSMTQKISIISFAQRHHEYDVNIIIAMISLIRRNHEIDVNRMKDIERFCAELPHRCVPPMSLRATPAQLRVDPRQKLQLQQQQQQQQQAAALAAAPARIDPHQRADPRIASPMTLLVTRRPAHSRPL
jgi:hypothetical protein